MSKEEPDPCAVLAAFLGQACRNSDDIYVAIDPGGTGAIAFLCGAYRAVVDIPVIKTAVKRTKKTSAKERAETGRKTKSVLGSTTRYNFATICAMFKLLRPYKKYVIITLEQVPFKVSRLKGYSYADVVIGRSYAMWPLFLYSKGYTVEEVSPAVWKKRFGLTGKDKEASRLKALSLFPGVPISRKKDHDRAEALLLAEYTRRDLSRH